MKGVFLGLSLVLSDPESFHKSPLSLCETVCVFFLWGIALIASQLLGLKFEIESQSVRGAHLTLNEFVLEAPVECG